MVLHHVAKCAGALVITAAAFHAERLRRGDLEMIDVMPAPKRPENRVRETQHENVLRGLFSKKMIDPISLFFAERIPDDPVELAGRGDVVTERFLHNHTRPAAFARLV